MNLKITKKQKIFLLVLAAIILVVLFFVLFKPVKKENINIPIEQPVVVETPVNKVSGQTAQELALQKAKEWQSDAILSYMASEKIAQAGTENWRLIFISASAENKGYEIKLDGGKITSGKEIDYFGQGEEFPRNTKMTQEQAEEQVLKMPGYEKAKILNIEAVYGVGTKTWYWGIKTDKGVVSMEMK